MDNKESKRILRKMLIDFTSIVVVALPLLIFKLYGRPFKRGFFCNDESLMHPFRENTVPSLAMYFIGFGLNVPIMLMTEYWRAQSPNADHTKRVLFGITIPLCIWESYKIIGVFCFGAASSQLTTDIAKYSVGRLRPHFFDVCRPDIDCTILENQHKYFEMFNCTGTHAYRLHDARLSFLSGHSSFSAYTMIFLALYVQARWTWRGSKLLRHLVQFVAFSIAWYIALSRISDYKHHWSDVLAGSAQGAIVCILVVWGISELFPKKSYKVSSNNGAETILPMVQKDRSNQELHDH